MKMTRKYQGKFLGSRDSDKKCHQSQNDKRILGEKKLFEVLQPMVEVYRGFLRVEEAKFLVACYVTLQPALSVGRSVEHTAPAQMP